MSFLTIYLIGIALCLTWVAAIIATRKNKLIHKTFDSDPKFKVKVCFIIFLVAFIPVLNILSIVVFTAIFIYVLMEVLGKETGRIKEYREKFFDFFTPDKED